MWCSTPEVNETWWRFGMYFDISRGYLVRELIPGFVFYKSPNSNVPIHSCCKLVTLLGSECTDHSKWSNNRIQSEAALAVSDHRFNSAGYRAVRDFILAHDGFNGLAKTLVYANTVRTGRNYDLKSALLQGHREFPVGRQCRNINSARQLLSIPDHSQISRHRPDNITCELRALSLNI